MIQGAFVEVHMLVGLGLLGLVAAIAVIAAPAAVRGHSPPALYPLLHRAAALFIAAEVILGAALFASGRRPHDGLHLLYAAAAILVMPLARSMVRRDKSKARLYQLGGTVLLLGVVFRLTATG
jgi:hypothetical protein